MLAVAHYQEHLFWLSLLLGAGLAWTLVAPAR
jgi:hypothetical protein